ncbi:zinc finger C-x8-C-x5-C-x3-H type family protein [Actinidia rufa]|uniref:Zinc finger C-x8-C-x5-C-x3-H type family protein n=1 Tax=Actinidia rufa TaxID=165716 RepID=A0A7J0EFX1_9ERIC|nr:zinc finger C-x8-C-x5-C-x3-H type family protein [Actinidia rufa]
MAEVAAVAVRAGVACENHAADLGLVPRMPDHRTQLHDAMRKLAVLSVGTLSCLLPLVAQLRLEHPLVVHFELQRFLLSLTPWHIHSLLFHTAR